MNDALSGAKRSLTTSACSRPSATTALPARADASAVALGTNRSFVSQLVNPAYAMPIWPSISKPFSRSVTLAGRSHCVSAVYDNAHPGRREPGESAAGSRVVSLTVPDLGNARRNQAVDALIAEYGRNVARLATLLKD
jgi:hypothetical protein